VKVSPWEPRWPRLKIQTVQVERSDSKIIHKESSFWVCLEKIEMEIKMKSITGSSKLVLLAGLLTASALTSVGVMAQDQVQTQIQIYGSQLMTVAERTEYQTQMRTLKIDKERDAFRLDHLNKMNVRAAEKGVTLPNPPPAAGTGPKANSGIGVGPGSGIGAGQGSATDSPAGGGKSLGR
jgi:hypothetical protein